MAEPQVAPPTEPAAKPQDTSQPQPKTEPQAEPPQEGRSLRQTRSRMSTRFGGKSTEEKKAEAEALEKEQAAKEKAAKAKGKTATGKRKRDGKDGATPRKKTPTPDEPVNVLPTKLVDGAPIPAMDTPQPLDLPDEEFRSVRESNVLSTALQRSREKWTGGEILKVFYSKTAYRTKEKDPNAPKVKSAHMANVKGPQIKMTAEPHSWFVDFWVVRREMGETVAQGTPITHGPSASKPPPVHHATPAYQPSPQPSTHHHRMTPQRPPPSYQPMPPSKAPPAAHPQTPAPPNAQSSAPPPQHAPDPVIHMLAQRAGTDMQLKEVMKIVAAGRATQPQLEYFQRHIDELTAILRAREAAAPPKPPPQPRPQPRPPPQPSVSHNPSPRVSTPATPATPRPPVQQHNTPHHPFHNTIQRSTPGHPQQQSPNVPFKPFKLLIEFFEAGKSNGSRLLFPQHAILWHPDPKNRGVLKAALLHVFEGEKGKEYYQPLTVTFEGDANMLENVWKGVFPPDESKKWMEDVMGRCERAREGWVAARLPRREDGEGTPKL